MNRIRISVLLALIAATQPLAAQAVPDFSSYRVIIDNNVFDPDRGASVQPPSRPSAPTRPPDYIDIRGVLLVNGTPLVVCRGSQPGWNGQFFPGDQLADWIIAQADTDAVRLIDAAKNERVAPVGSRLLNREDAWILTTPTRPDSAADDDADNPPRDSAAAEPSAAGDLLRQLRERRQKELNQ